MPRIADHHLEERILKAAQRLWRKHGDKSLTLRSVAREAGTTTTTVYKRFRNKAAILVALAERVQARMTQEATSAATVEECLRRFLDFADKHPHEYTLLWGPAWSEIYAPGKPRPVATWLMERLADRFGGQPEDYVDAYFATFFVMHGTASLLITARNARTKINLRNKCLTICDRLLARIEVLQTEGR